LKYRSFITLIFAAAMVLFLEMARKSIVIFASIACTR
jgi:hypothetical protein